jgi:hypothetical protein
MYRAVLTVLLLPLVAAGQLPGPIDSEDDVYSLPASSSEESAVISQSIDVVAVESIASETPTEKQPTTAQKVANNKFWCEVTIVINNVGVVHEGWLVAFDEDKVTIRSEGSAQIGFPIPGKLPNLRRLFKNIGFATTSFDLGSVSGITLKKTKTTKAILSRTSDPATEVEAVFSRQVAPPAVSHNGTAPRGETPPTVSEWAAPSPVAANTPPSTKFFAPQAANPAWPAAGPGELPLPLPIQTSNPWRSRSATPSPSKSPLSNSSPPFGAALVPFVGPSGCLPTPANSAAAWKLIPAFGSLGVMPHTVLAPPIFPPSFPAGPSTIDRLTEKLTELAIENGRLQGREEMREQMINAVAEKSRIQSQLAVLQATLQLSAAIASLPPDTSPQATTRLLQESLQQQAAQLSVGVQRR